MLCHECILFARPLPDCCAGLRAGAPATTGKQTICMCSVIAMHFQTHCTAPRCAYVYCTLKCCAVLQAAGCAGHVQCVSLCLYCLHCDHCTACCTACCPACTAGCWMCWTRTSLWCGSTASSAQITCQAWLYCLTRVFTVLYCSLLDVLGTYKPAAFLCTVCFVIFVVYSLPCGKRTACFAAWVVTIVLPVQQAAGCAGHVQAMGSSLYCWHAGQCTVCCTACTAGCWMCWTRTSL
jgi:hypothetical protein